MAYQATVLMAATPSTEPDRLRLEALALRQENEELKARLERSEVQLSLLTWSLEQSLRIAKARGEPEKLRGAPHEPAVAR
jgi:hypothetical protein